MNNLQPTERPPKAPEQAAHPGPGETECLSATAHPRVWELPAGPTWPAMAALAHVYYSENDPQLSRLVIDELRAEFVLGHATHESVEADEHARRGRRPAVDEARQLLRTIRHERGHYLAERALAAGDPLRDPAWPVPAEEPTPLADDAAAAAEVELSDGGDHS